MIRRVLSSLLAVALLWSSPAQALTLAQKQIVLFGRKPLVLDGVANVFAAYSFRKLLTAYSGPCVRIRRSSDNTEQDFGFVNNVCDVAGIAAFVGAGTGYVTKWYDQSGNNRVVAQATSGTQPPITLNGAGAGKAALQIRDSGSIVNLSSSSYTLSGSALLAFGVSKENAGGYNYAPARIFSMGLVSNSGFYANDSGGSKAPSIAINAGLFGTFSLGSYLDGLYHQYDAEITPTTADFFRDGSSLSLSSSGFSGSVSVTSTIFMGSTNSSFNGVNALSEVIILASDTPNRAAIRANEKAFWGTP